MSRETVGIWLRAIVFSALLMGSSTAVWAHGTDAGHDTDFHESDVADGGEAGSHHADAGSGHSHDNGHDEEEGSGGCSTSSNGDPSPGAILIAALACAAIRLRDSSR